MSKSLRHAARVAAALAMIALQRAPLAAQHEHHDVAGAATTVVSGRVLCEEGAPLPQAVVQAFHVGADGRHLRAGVLTDENGRFAFRVAPGDYAVGVSFIGHTAADVALSVAAAPVGIGDVRLALAAIEMDALTIAAAAEPVRLRSGSAVVEADAATVVSGTVADVLRTVPGVEIDRDGHITLRGSSGVLVLIDGRPAPLEGAALLAFLRQMPASALERIEAGTTAAASEQAEGGAGVVNIVLSADAMRTTDLRSVAASIASDDHYLASAALTGRVGGAIAWDASWSGSSMRPRTESTTLRTSLDAGDSNSSSEQASDARARHRLNALGASIGAQLTSAIALDARAQAALMEGLFRNRTRFEDRAADGGLTVRDTRSRLDHTIPNANGSIGLRWTGAALRVRSELRAGAVEEDFTGEYFDQAGTLELTRDMTSSHRDYGARNDIAFELRGTSVELGHAWTQRTIDAEYRSDGGDAVALSEFAHEERVDAGYMSLGRSFGGVRAVAGLRAEHERTDAGGIDARRDARWRAFPSLQLDWVPDAGGAMRYRLTYGRRIDRPDFSALNPFGMGEDDMNAVVGNPQLRPEVVDQLEIGVERHGAASVLQLTPFLRVSNDPIRPLKAVTESGHATTTLHNLSRATAAGVDASVRFPLTDRATATLSGSVAHVETEGVTYGSSGVSFTSRALVDVYIDERTSLQLYAYRRGSQAIEQGEILPGTTTDFALTRRWGDEANGRLTLRVSDPFRTSDLAYRIGDPDFEQESRRLTRRPLLSLFASWAVGGEPIEQHRDVDENPTLF